MRGIETWQAPCPRLHGKVIACCIAALASIWTASRVTADDAGPAKSAFARMAGVLVLCADDTPCDAVASLLVERSGDGAVCIVALSPDAQQSAAAAASAIEGDTEVTTVTLTGDMAEAPLAAKLAAADAVWLVGELEDVGDDPESPLSAALSAVLARDGLVGGPGACRLEEQSGGLVVDKAYLAAKPSDAAVERLKNETGAVGLGISPGTAIVVEGRRLRVVGAGDAVVCLPPGADRPPRMRRIAAGGVDDRLALHRAATARSGEAFPAAKPAPPRVDDGSLLICGGGRLDDDVWRTFLELAGGADAPIVVLPTASPNPSTRSAAAAKLRRLGAADVTVLPQRGAAEVETPEFTAALKRARGVWFDGGRQWRFIDAYEGTTAESLFADVLARGGVIGGTSAGASIQAEYMVRGSPLRNTIMMAEGYERGLGFLSGVAIDQHFTQRKRFDDLASVVRRFPQLLGIGLDEGTAVVVQGTGMRVVGKNRVAVLSAADDGERPAAVWLSAGDRYDLHNRRTLSVEPAEQD